MFLIDDKIQKIRIRLHLILMIIYDDKNIIFLFIVITVHKYIIKVLMDSSEDEGFAQTQFDAFTIKEPMSDNIRQTKPNKSNFLNKHPLSLHFQLPLYHYPKNMDSIDTINTCLTSSTIQKQFNQLVQKNQNSLQQLLSDFFPRKLVCIYNRFRQNFAFKRDIAIIIRNIARRIRNEQLTTFMPRPQLKQLKGEGLFFCSNFQGGNLHCVFKDKKTNINYLLLQNDINTHGYNLWFNFNVKSFEKAKHQFVIANLSRAINLNGQFSLITYNTTLAQFQRKTPFRCTQSRFNHCDSTRNYWNLHFQYEFQSNEEIFFMLTVPYSYSKMLKFIRTVDSKNYSKITLITHLVTNSQLGNLIPCLQISHSKNNKNKKGIIITARQHPSQTVGSFVCEQIIKILLSQNQLSLNLLDKFTFYVIPMVNSDGVIHGNSRTNLMGYDLNRCWSKASIQYSNQCQNIWTFLQNIVKNNKVIWSIDLHGHSRQLGYFAYFSQKTERSLLISHLLTSNCNYFNGKKCRYQLSYSKRQSIRGQMHQRMKIQNAVTIQISLFGYRTDEGHFKHFQLSHFVEMGSNILKSLYSAQQTMQNRIIKQKMITKINLQLNQIKNKKIEKEEDLDSDSNPQQDYLLNSERNLQQNSIIYNKQIIKRKNKTERSPIRDKKQFNSKIQKPMLNLTSTKRVYAQKEPHLKTNSQRQLQKPKSNQRIQLFNLTFFASRSRVFVSQVEEQKPAFYRRKVYSSMRNQRQNNRNISSQSIQAMKDLKKSLQMRKCIRLAFDVRSRSQQERSRSNKIENNVKTVLYPTMNSGFGLDIKKSLKERRQKMKQLRCQQYGNLLVRSIIDNNAAIAPKKSQI